MQISPSVAVLDGPAGGMVLVNGWAAYCWDADEPVLRRFAAVGASRLPDVTDVAVAAAFSTTTVTLWRWRTAVAGSGPAGLVGSRIGPKGPSKLTPQLRAEVVALHRAGVVIAGIADRVGVSTFTVRNALGRVPAGTGTRSGTGTSSIDSRDSGSTDDTWSTSAGPAVSTSGSTADSTPGGAADGTADGAIGGADAGAEAGAEIGSAVTGPVDAGVAVEPVLPVLPAAVDRSGERVAARFGLVPCAPPVFAPAGRVPLAGLLLAVPALAATGLLDCATTVYPGVLGGFYGLDTMLLEAVFRALAGEPRAEGATRVNPTDLGRVLGLDRAPEVKTIRRKIGLLADQRKADDLLEALARHHTRAHQEQLSVLYVDGHVRSYHGTRKVQKTHVARLRFPAPATVETWVCDAAGDPVWVVMAEPGASLAAELRRLIPQVRGIIGDDRRVLVGFDRGGWSPALFADLTDAGFDVLTWRKGPVIPDVPTDRFSVHTHTDQAGRSPSWQLADTTVDLPITDGNRKGQTVTLRQVTKLDPSTGTGTGRQVHILTSRTDLTPAEVVYRMGSRWRIENYFRYARMHFDLDSHDSYQAGHDDPDRSVPNPAKKTTHRHVQTARARLTAAETVRDEQLLALRSPTPGTPSLLTNQLHNQLNAPVHTAQADLDTAITTHQATPTRLPLSKVNPDQHVLDTETKLITHAIRMAAYNTMTALARTIKTGTGYARADHEAHTLLRTALTGSGDLNPTTGILHVHLDPLPTPRATTAIAELCQHLNDTHTIYPGTDLELHYSVKPHH